MTEEQNRNCPPWEWKWNFWDRERDPVKYWLCRIVVWIINIVLGLGLMGCINWVLGNGGHFLSRHYDDLGNLWRRGEYVPMSLDPNLARGASLGVTKIVPTIIN